MKTVIQSIIDVLEPHKNTYPKMNTKDVLDILYSNLKAERGQIIEAWNNGDKAIGLNQTAEKYFTDTFDT